MLLAVGAVAWVHLGARRGSRSRARVSARRVLEDDPSASTSASARRPLALPAGADRGPAAAARRRRSGRAAARRTSRSTRASRGAGASARRAARHRPRPVRPRDAAVVQGGRRAEVLVLPRIATVVTPAGAGDGTGLAARRGRPSVAAEVDLDGLRPHRAGRARLADLLAGARPRRGARRAPPARRHRHAAARRARPARRRGRRAARRGRPRRRLARRPPGRATAAARCCCPGDRRPTVARADAGRVAARARAPAPS